MRRGWLGLVALCWVLALAGCAAPALVLYTLAPAAPETPDTPLGRKPTVIAVSRVTLPDSLDTEDITFRDGNILRRSHSGRWASRLSLGITDRLTDRLATRWPQALVTARPLSETPTDRILVNISRLDVNDTGVAVLEADWMIVPADAHKPVMRNRARFTLQGAVQTDQDIVNLMGDLVDKLADAIDVGPMP
jgi:uncharacterized lipoprotein YmbA